MTQEQLRMQMLAGIITEGQYKNMLNKNKFKMIGSDKDDLLDAISILNRDMMNSKRLFKDELKPLNSTLHKISDGKFSIEVEKIGDTEDNDTEDNEYLRLANDYLEERGYQSKLYKAN
jgi:vacuolar-type H+-ATPase subunit B/Vma2